MKKAIAWALDSAGKPVPLNSGAFDLEKHLEEWVDADPSIVADDVLLIGRQVATSYGTIIDLLGIDSQGNLVVIELKRDQTLRETVAQGIEYAAWCSKLGYEDVSNIASKRYKSQEGFKAAFQDHFSLTLPATLNGSQRILLVAPEITDATSEVVGYLSQNFQIPINAVSFDVFDIDGKKVIVRHLVRDEVSDAPTKTTKSTTRTLDEYVAAAYQNGVGQAFEHLLKLTDIFPTVSRYQQCVLLRGLSPARKSLAGLTIYPTSDSNPNTIQLWLFPGNLELLFSISSERCQAFISEVKAIGVATTNSAGYVRLMLSTLEQAESLALRLRSFAHETAKEAQAIGVSDGAVVSDED